MFSSLVFGYQRRALVNNALSAALSPKSTRCLSFVFLHFMSHVNFFHFGLSIARALSVYSFIYTTFINWIQRHWKGFHKHFSSIKLIKVMLVSNSEHWKEAFDWIIAMSSLKFSKWLALRRNNRLNCINLAVRLITAGKFAQRNRHPSCRAHHGMKTST